MPDEKLPLILHPGSGLALVGPHGGRIVAEMVSGALALSRPAAALTEELKLVPPFKIGDYEWCEPDYRQILRWAEATGMEPVEVIKSLRIEPELSKKRTALDYLYEYTNIRTKIKNGRIIQLQLNLELLPLNSFEWEDGLVIEAIRLNFRDEPAPPKRNLSLPFPELRHLECSSLGLVSLDLSAVPKLTNLSCDDNRLTALDLSAVPQLTELSCSRNQLTALDLSAAPQLTELSCSDNQIASLNLSAVPKLRELDCTKNRLTSLVLPRTPYLDKISSSRNRLTWIDFPKLPQLYTIWCCDNQLNEIDLSGVPLLTNLSCGGNRLAFLDIRLSPGLKELLFDADKTRLIQRPDQNF